MTEGQVPPRVQWEGLLDRGAYYLSPQHCIVFHRKHNCCVPETAVNPLMCVFFIWPNCSRVNIKDPDGCNTKS